MAFDGTEEHPTEEQASHPAAYSPPLPDSPAAYSPPLPDPPAMDPPPDAIEPAALDMLPPLIPPASREPVWLLVVGVLCFLGLMGLIWQNHRQESGGRSPDFQTTITARTSTYLVELLEYHRLRGELPAWATQALPVVELANRTAGDWQSVSGDSPDGEYAGLTLLNAAALSHAAGDDIGARAMLTNAAMRDPARAAQYEQLWQLYAIMPRSVRETPALHGMLERISAGPLVRARMAGLRRDTGAEMAALLPGARAGQRFILVSGGLMFGIIALLLSVLVALIITAPRLTATLQDVERAPGAEMPWGMGTGLIVISLSYFTVSFIRSLLAGWLSVPQGTDADLVLNLLATLLGPLLIVSLFLLALGRKPWEWSAVGWLPARRGMRYGFTVLLLALPLILAASYLSGIIFGSRQGANPLISEMMTTPNHLLLAILILTAVVVAPLTEETMFRGILFRAANARLPFWAAAFGSGFVFAMGHYSLVALLPITLIGTLLALLTRRTDSLLASAAAHAGYNGLITAVTLLMAWALRGPGS